MLRLLSRGLLTAALVLAYSAHHERLAYADDDDEEEDDGGGDKAGAGEGEEEEEGEGEDEVDKDQPDVTAGGLFTMKSYPVREISRPLTMTVGIAQARVAAGTDLSAKGAFKTGGLSVEGIYGQSDNFNLIGGFTNAYNMRQFGAYFGFEGALAYDVVDIRVAANIHRNALPNFSSFCTPVSSADMVDQVSPLPSQCGASGAAIVNLPNGNYNSGDIKFSVELGFPFRYAIKPEVAIVALQTLMTIDFNSVAKDHVITEKKDVMDPTTGMMVTQVKNVPVGNNATPDLNPSVGIATNPIPPLSVVIFAQLRIPDFDTAAGAFQVPVTGRIEFSPNQKFDLGLEFTLLNVKPPEGQSPIDNRFLSLFVQSRFGK
jgi:hypothetical protein